MSDPIVKLQETIERIERNLSKHLRKQDGRKFDVGPTYFLGFMDGQIASLKIAIMVIKDARTANHIWGEETESYRGPDGVLGNDFQG